MVLAASMVVRNELDRYLPLVIEHLREFTDQITVLDDRSTDGTLSWLHNQIDGHLSVAGDPVHTFDQHEGHVRQRLLEATLAREPTHVLAIDADEFIADGEGLRAALEANPDTPAWTLRMTEVWSVTPEALQVRMDGAWRPYARVHLWRVPDVIDASCRIPERPLACPPVPRVALQARAHDSGQTIFHFGWADPATRRSRFDRYMALDGGRFHARAHLQSIMHPPQMIALQEQPWPNTAWATHVREKLLPVSEVPA